jgi:hypothetical protein
MTKRRRVGVGKAKIGRILVKNARDRHVGQTKIVIDNFL